MRMDAGLDTGPIVAQVRRALDGTETTPGAGGRACRRWPPISSPTGSARGSAASSSPRHRPPRAATLTRPLRREDGRLDPDPGGGGPGAPGPCVSAVAGVVRGHDRRAARRLVGDGGSGRTGGGGTGDVRRARSRRRSAMSACVLHEVQPAGGRRMSWDAYVRGGRRSSGSRGPAWADSGGPNERPERAAQLSRSEIVVGCRPPARSRRTIEGSASNVW